MTDLRPANWTPTAAREVLLALYSHATDAGEQALLRRLAGDGDERMRGVWQRLPHTPAGLEGALIEMAFAAPGRTFKRTISRAPFQSNARDAENKVRQRMGAPEPWFGSEIATCLLDAMMQTEEVRDRWAALWQGGPGVSFEDAKNTVIEIGLLFCRLQPEVNYKIPAPPKHMNSEDTLRAVVIDATSLWFKKMYGSPHNKIVTDLVCAILNDDDIEDDLVKKRAQRRGTK